MRNNLRLLILSLTLVLSSSLLYGSNEPTKLTVYYKDGTTADFLLSEKPGVTFLSDNAIFTTENASPIQIELSNVKGFALTQGEIKEYIPSKQSVPGGTQTITISAGSQIEPDPDPVDDPEPQPTYTNISEATITLATTSYDYTGSPIEPDLTVEYQGTPLTRGEDYIVSYNPNNTLPGEVTMTISGKGSYNGSVTKTFSIILVQTVTAKINGESVEPTLTTLQNNVVEAVFETQEGRIKVNNCYALPGTTITIFVTPKAGYTISKSDITPELEGDDPANLGSFRSYSYVMPTSGNVTIEATFTENMDLSEAEFALIDEQQKFFYTGDSIKPGCTLTLKGQPLEEGTDYTIQYKNNVNAGKATITATSMGIYTGTATTEFTINKVPLTVMANDTTMVYGEELPELTATITGFVNDEDSTILTKQPVITTEATATSPVGEYAITVSGAAAQNYDFTYEEGAKLTISKAMLTVKANDATKVYGEELPELTATITGFVNDETPTVLTTQPVVTTEATATSPVDEYAITVSGAAAQNYDFTYEEGATLTVSKAMLTVKANDATKVYGEELPELTYTISGFVNDEDVSVLTKQPEITTDATAESRVDKYDITVSGAEAANYDFTYEGAKLTVTPRSIVGSTLTLDAEKYAYTGKAVEPTVTVQCGFATLTEATDFTASSTNNTEPGTATLTVVGQGNYEGQIDTTFVIYLKPSLHVVINDEQITPEIDELFNNSAPATFESEQGVIEVDNLYATTGSTVVLTVTPKRPYYIFKEDISGIELIGSNPADSTAQHRYRYVVPEGGEVIIEAVFSVDSIALGISNRPTGALRFEVVDGQTVRVLGTRETAPVSVFDARGQQVAAEVVRSERELLVRLNRQPQGLYIIKVNNKTFKVYRK